MDYIILDIETTGLSHEYGDKIVEIGAVKIIDGTISEKYNTLVNPESIIPAKTTELNKITNEMVKDSPKISAVIPNLLKFVQDLPIVGYNIKFDMNFINTEIGKAGRRRIPNEVIDLYPFCRKLFPNLKSYTLGNVAKHLNIDADNYHRSMGDCLITYGIFAKILDKLKSEGISGLEAIRNYYVASSEELKNPFKYDKIYFESCFDKDSNEDGVADGFKILSRGTENPEKFGRIEKDEDSRFTQRVDVNGKGDGVILSSDNFEIEQSECLISFYSEASEVTNFHSILTLFDENGNPISATWIPSAFVPERPENVWNWERTNQNYPVHFKTGSWDWQKTEFIVTVPAEAKSAKMEFLVFTYGGQFWIRELKIAKITETPQRQRIREKLLGEKKTFHLFNNVNVDVHEYNGNFLGIGRILINGIPVRAENYFIKPLIETDNGGKYSSCALAGIDNLGNSLRINCELRERNRDTGDYLAILITPEKVNIDGIEHIGISYYYEFKSETNTAFSLLDRTSWELGGFADRHFIIQQTSHTPGPLIEIQKKTNLFTWTASRFSYNQCFDYQYSHSGSLVIFYETAGHIDSGQFKPYMDGKIFHLDFIRFEGAMSFKTPKKYVLFSKHKGINHWTTIHGYLFSKYKNDNGLKAEELKPFADYSFKFYRKDDVTFREVAENIIPSVAQLGFKYIFIGPVFDNLIAVNQMNYNINPDYGGDEGLKYLCAKAKEHDVEIIVWISFGDLARTSPLLQEHPDWQVKYKNGHVYRYCYGEDWCDLSAIDLANPQVIEYIDERINHFRKNLGVGGVWWDSFHTLAYDVINYKDSSKPTLQCDNALAIMRKLHDLGYRVFTESFSPFGTTAYPFDFGFKGLYRNREEFAYKTSLLTFEDNMATESYFRFLANKAPAILPYKPDIQTEEYLKQIGVLNTAYNKVIKYMDTRTVLEKGFGILWDDKEKKRKVIFAYRNFQIRAEVNFSRVINAITGEETVLDSTRTFKPRAQQIYLFL